MDSVLGAVAEALCSVVELLQAIPGMIIGLRFDTKQEGK